MQNKLTQLYKAEALPDAMHVKEGCFLKSEIYVQIDASYSSSNYSK